MLSSIFEKISLNLRRLHVPICNFEGEHIFMNVLKKRKMYLFWGKFKYEGEDVYMRESCIYEREFVFMKAKMYS